MEQLLYHIWQYGLFSHYELKMTDGHLFELIDVGRYNSNSGPDFFNAKIKCEGTVWAGNVEIHERSSDWYQHQHHNDPAYDSVILHVVCRHDSEIYRSNGERIAQFVLPLSEQMLADYAFLGDQHPDVIPCAFRLSEINPIFFADWKNALAMERLIRKADRVQELVDRSCGDWEEAFYILLSRSFGTGVNSDAFERLARSLPYHYLLKHVDSLLQTEAFLFGQAGFLEDSFDHPYYLLLQREYRLLQTKFRVNPLPKTMWRFFRLRPTAFPQLRIASLALVLHQSPRLFSLLMDYKDMAQLKTPFQLELHDFWSSHYQFDSVSVELNKGLGMQTIESILINTFVPVLYAYGCYLDDISRQERAVELLMSLNAENNYFVRRWREAGVSALDAFETQAILELQKEYCDRKRCLQCRIGHQLLACHINF